MSRKKCLIILFFIWVTTLEFYLQNDTQNTPEALKDRIVLFARNQELSLFMGNNFTSLPSPNSFGYFLKTSVALKNWKAGTWHHIAFKWKKIGNNRYKVGPVYLDGIPSFNTYTSEFTYNPKVNSMFFGSNRFRDMISNGYPLTADATIQSIRIYSSSSIVDPSGTSGFFVPDRYSPSQKNTYEGTIFDFGASGVPSIKSVKILGISWTERIPRDGGDIWVDLKIVKPRQTTDPKGDPYEVIKEWKNLGRDDTPEEFCYDSGGSKITHYPDNIEDCWSKKGVEIGLSTFSNEYLKITGNEKIIIKATFKLPQTAPVLESPHLEDVTISLITGEPKILRSWEEAKPSE